MASKNSGPALDPATKLIVETKVLKNINEEIPIKNVKSFPYEAQDEKQNNPRKIFDAQD
jgi:hypothetical protein